MNAPTNDRPGITLAVFQETGQLLYSKPVETDDKQLSHQLVEQLSDRLKHLSGDLELPLEGRLPWAESEVAFRISSDLQSSFTFYYLGTEVIGISLTLLGAEPDPEAEMIDSIRLLLLDHEDREELDDEQIELILAIDQFEFHSFTQRPIHFFVPLKPQSAESHWQETQDALIHASLHLAMALYQPED